MIERNRGKDTADICRLEDKIKQLESQITVAKKAGEDRKLDRLEASLQDVSGDNLLGDTLLEQELTLREDELGLIN